MKRPDMSPRESGDQSLMSTRELRLIRVTMRHVRSDDGQARLAALRELQSAAGEELRPFFGRTLMASILDRVFKGEW